MDIVVSDLLVLELKSIEKLLPIHKAQLLTYLRLSKIWLGLLIKFNVPILKQGIKRLVHGKVLCTLENKLRLFRGFVVKFYTLFVYND